MPDAQKICLAVHMRVGADYFFFFLSFLAHCISATAPAVSCAMCGTEVRNQVSLGPNACNTITKYPCGAYYSELVVHPIVQEVKRLVL